MAANFVAGGDNLARQRGIFPRAPAFDEKSCGNPVPIEQIQNALDAATGSVNAVGQSAARVAVFEQIERLTKVVAG